VDLRALLEVPIVVESFNLGRRVGLRILSGNADSHSGFKIRSLADLAVTRDFDVGSQSIRMLFRALRVRHHELIAADADGFAVVTPARERRVLVESFDPGRRMPVRGVRGHADFHPRLEVCRRAGLAIAGFDAARWLQRLIMFWT
jgi:hypothetical protein